ncbi:glycosyltransferase [Porticoccaceae bacterium]|nr:glycosyltransferase [Porticoccaceae bacterium]
MYILIVIPSFYPAVVYGGPIFSSLFSARSLSSFDKFVVRVATTNANMDSRLNVDTGSWLPFDSGLMIKYYNDTFVGRFSASLIVNLWKDIADADVVHVQSIFSTPTVAALLYSSILKKPVVLSARGQLNSWCLANGSRFKGVWLRVLIQPFVKNLTWHATSEKEKSDILERYPRSEVQVIPNGVELNSSLSPTSLERCSFAKRFGGVEADVDKIVVSMARLDSVKGLDILINSFFHVLEAFPKAKLFIAGGDNGEKENLSRLICDLGLTESVCLIGEIAGDDKLDFLANADLFVLPSHSENFGNVYIESLAAGTPIVASTNTPWSEVVDAKCGQWVPNDIRSTSRAMTEMLGQDRDLMRVNAQTHAQKYDWKNIAIQFKALFEKVGGSL